MSSPSKEPKAPPAEGGGATQTRYKRLLEKSPVQVIAGREDHPLQEVGGAYFPGGAGWLLRAMHSKENLPKDPFIYAPNEGQRLEMKSRLMGNVDISPEAVLAHEMGHAGDHAEGGLSGKLLQSPFVRGSSGSLGSLLGPLGGALAAGALRDRGGLAAKAAIPTAVALGAAGGALGNVPTLLSERRATRRGLDRLRGVGADDASMARYKDELGQAMGTYKRNAILSSVLGGALGGGMAAASKFAAAPSGFYKGEPISPHTVKFKTEFAGIPINVDRPKGFIMKGTDAQGRDWARRYKYDYGFIPKTLGGDGDGLDVFIGPNKKSQDAFWAVQRKDDGTFDEYKVFLGFNNRDEAISAYRQHIPKKYFKGIITMKLEMMKAMLGKVDPNHQIKRASALGFIDELGWLMGKTAEVPLDLEGLKELYQQSAEWVPPRVPPQLAERVMAEAGKLKKLIPHKEEA